MNGYSELSYYTAHGEYEWKPCYYGGIVCWHHFLRASLQTVADNKILSTASFPCKKCKDLSGHSVGGGNKVTLASTSEEYDPWCQRWKGSLRMARNFGRAKGGRKMVKSPVEKHHHVTGDFLVGNVVSGLSFFCSKKSQVGRHLHLPSWERSHTPFKGLFFSRWFSKKGGIKRTQFQKVCV